MTDRVLVSAVALIRDGHVLTVRKRGTARFMLVGGKPEPGEDAEACARRETLEEVGVQTWDLAALGRRVAPAANEAGLLVVGDCFEASWTGEPAAAAEIEELRWIPLSALPADDLAPLLTLRALPILRRRHGVTPDGFATLSVRPAVAQDLAALPDLESIGDLPFAEVGLEFIATAPLTPVAAYADALADHHLFVAEAAGAIIGFAKSGTVDGQPYLDQVSVHPAWSGLGIGARLIEDLVDRLGQQGFARVTLRTFRDVPWNAPYYARLGWSPLPESAYGPEMRALAAADTAHGLAAAPRIAMVRASTAP